MTSESDYIVAIEGLEARPIETLSAGLLVAAQRTVNRTADRGATASRRRMQTQVNFKAQYLSGVDSTGRQRLGVSKRASTGSLEAIVTGRHRPTSLAQFVTGSKTPGKTGVSVQVAPGFARYMKRAFLIRLPAGKNIDTQSNLGLAMRLKPNEVIHNKRVMQRIAGNLYVLYGPSVDQVFPSVIEEITPDLEDFLGTEFIRQAGLN